MTESGNREPADDSVQLFNLGSFYVFGLRGLCLRRLLLPEANQQFFMFLRRQLPDRPDPDALRAHAVCNDQFTESRANPACRAPETDTPGRPQVEGRAVASTHDLLEAVAAAGPGSNIALEIWRGSERIETRTTTIERPRLAEH